MTELKFAQGFCSPVRGNVLTALRNYGFVEGKNGFYLQTYYDPRAGSEAGITNFTGTPQDNVAVITIPESRAAWCEYLICATGKFSLMHDPPVDERNIRWAKKWTDLPKDWRQAGCMDTERDIEQGRMPRSWASKARAQAKQAGGIFGGLAAMFQDKPTPPRRQRRQRRQRRGSR